MNSNLHDEVAAKDGDSEAETAGEDDGTLIAMMRAVLARRLNQMKRTPMEEGDKEMQLLGHMSRTLGKLIELDRSRMAEAAERSAAASPEMAELRKKIAERIAELNRG